MSEQINVTRSSMPPYEEYIREIKDLWESHWLTNMGKKHEELTEQLKDYLEAEKLTLLANGHLSLELAIQAFGLSGEVITTPFTFISTTHAIVRNHLTPVFCDIDPTDCTIDVSKIEELITPNTSAIIPVHVYGNICNVDMIDKIAKKHGLKVIYDAAHAFGVKQDGRSVAGFGDASIYSFHATKVFNTVEGGAVVFHDPEVGARLYDLKNFGIHGTEKVESIGANAKLDEFRAAMGICNLRYVNAEIQKRKKIVEHYRKRLEGYDGITFFRESEGIESNYAYFPIFADWRRFGKSRNEIYHTLREHGIFSRKYFYPLTSEAECYHEMFNTKLTPVALEKSRQVLCLPLYADLSEEKVDEICDWILA